MRCPNCAGEIHDQSRFCGICGRGVELPQDAPPAPPWDDQAAGPPSSMSLFELPVSGRARALRVALILVLDTLLVGVGVALILSYVGARDRARSGIGGQAELDPAPVTSTVEILEPTALPEADPATPESPSKRPRQASEPSARKSPPSTPSRSREPGAAPPPPTAPRDTEPTESPAPTEEATPMSEAELEMATRKVAGVVKSHQAQFERCSRQVAKGAGPVQGNVVIRFAVSSDGRASDVRATTNTTGSDRLADCLVAQFESWTFPPHSSAQPLAFLWPLVFKAPQ
jgi:outer membrane biosynthesis protein TonB